MATVPVTPKVVSWAVEHSGYSLDEIAAAVEADVDSVRHWMRGGSQPSLGEARKLAKKLRRPLAFFLWPEPPSDEPPSVAFRAPIADDLRDLNATERRYIRQARRLQELQEYLRRELGEEAPEIPTCHRSMEPHVAAKYARDWIGISDDDQVKWPSEYVAFDQWRSRLESLGILVFRLPLGQDACRGITLASESMPVIVVNTAFNARARIYSLFHELAHVVTRTTSACAASLSPADDQAEELERWCEQFAADVLLPWGSVDTFLKERGYRGMLDDLAVAVDISNRYKVSIPAAALRLIKANRATWKLWHAIPRDVNAKRKGGGKQDEPRTTSVVRLHEFGMPAAQRLVRGIKADVIDRSQVASYLRIDDGSLTEIEGRVEKVVAGGGR